MRAYVRARNAPLLLVSLSRKAGSRFLAVLTALDALRVNYEAAGAARVRVRASLCFLSRLLASCEWRPIARVAAAGTRKLSMAVPDQRDRSLSCLVGPKGTWRAGFVWLGDIDRSRAIRDQAARTT
jgi:hypothetical protein